MQGTQDKNPGGIPMKKVMLAVMVAALAIATVGTFGAAAGAGAGPGIVSVARR
jgi:hypothetical protein